MAGCRTIDVTRETRATDWKEWIVIFVFALLASTVLYITIDLARPMQGLIKPDTGQQTIINLRKLF